MNKIKKKLILCFLVLASAILDAEDINDISLEEEKPNEDKNEDGSNYVEEPVLRTNEIKKESTPMEIEETIETVDEETPSIVINIKTEKSENLVTKPENVSEQQSLTKQEDVSQTQKVSNQQEEEVETVKEIVKNDKMPSESIKEQIEKEKTDEEPISTAFKTE